MKKIILILTAATTVFFTGCNKDNKVDFNATNEPEAPNAYASALPKFPANVLLELENEYNAIVDGSSSKPSTYNGVDVKTLSKSAFIELRLIDLYPNTAYSGMMQAAENEANQMRSDYEAYLNNLYAWEASNGISQTQIDEDASEYEYSGVEKEIEIMQMSTAEANEYRRLNDLAKAPVYANLNDINNIQERSRSAVAAAGISIACVAVVGIYAYYRAKLCEERATSKASEYFPGYNSGMKGDAFKHTYVSMMLRRYLTELSAYLIMDIYWENYLESNGPARDKYMDLHNNYVGRHSKYSKFRGSFFGDLFKWEKWGERVRDFINDDSNKALKSWTESTSENDIKAEEKSTDNSKYIIYTE